MINSIHLQSTIDVVIMDVINGRYQSIDTGLTAARPSLPQSGQSFFDSTLGKPIWWDGTQWVDATGTVV